MNRDRYSEERFAAWYRKTEAEKALEPIVLAAIENWLDAVKAAILDDNPPPDDAVTAAGFFRSVWRLDNAAAATRTWLADLRTKIAPTISVSFGEAFRRTARTADFAPERWQDEHIADVVDRLKIWPEEAFEELRPELQEALAEGASIDEVQDRIGAILSIDHVTRDAKGRINEINKKIADPETPPDELAELYEQKRSWWATHDESLQDWEWKARRIARTEIHGAVEGGNYAATRAWSIATGEQMYKRWLATPDTRVRHTHWLADGQTVKLEELFTVGLAKLRFPADPEGTDHPGEVINCRCTLLWQTMDEVQYDLQGADGSMGAVTPQGVRFGPDPDEAVAAALAELKGAQVEDRADPDRVPPPLFPHPEDEPPLIAAGLKYVRTPKGARRYRRPIGSIIGNGVWTPNLNDPALPPAWSTWEFREITLRGHRPHRRGQKIQGGHAAGNGFPGKTEFPQWWDDAKSLEAIATARLRPQFIGPVLGSGHHQHVAIVDDVAVYVSFMPATQGAPEKAKHAYPIFGEGVGFNGRPQNRAPRSVPELLAAGFVITV